MPDTRWTVSQISARQHYAVPRAFARMNKLRRLYTDIWCHYGSSLLLRGPSFCRTLAKRYHPELGNASVKSFPQLEIKRRLRQRLNGPAESREALFLEVLSISGAFDSLVRDHMARQSMDPSRDAFFGFAGASLRSLELCAERGVPSIVDQMDAARVEQEIIIAENERWEGWQRFPGRIPEEFWTKLESEWSTASLVLVNSDWTRKALISEGVPEEKIFIVPIAYEPEGDCQSRPTNTDGPLRILWLGQVNLRKGIPYLVEAAKQLTGRTIEFTIAGPININESLLPSMPANLQFLGKVTRDRIDQVYRDADVFVLPTLSDGFAITQLEAMANGLPVIATPNCGEVVEHGIDGLIVPPRDSNALAEAIASFDDDRSMLEAMSQAALRKSSTFTIDRYGQLVSEAITKYRSQGHLLVEAQ